MTLINTGYSAVLPTMGDVAGERSSFTAKANMPIDAPLPLARVNGHSSSNIDWSSFGETISHQTITLQPNINATSGEGLDVLVNAILSHIGSDVPDLGL